MKKIIRIYFRKSGIKYHTIVYYKPQNCGYVPSKGHYIIDIQILNWYDLACYKK